MRHFVCRAGILSLVLFASSVAAQQPAPMVAAVGSNMNHVPSFVGVEKRIFLKHGIDLKLKVLATGQEMAKALEAGEPRIFDQAVRTLGGTRRHIIFQVLIPGAMPNIVTGIRMSISFGWRAVIAAEMIATSTGLGFMIYNASNFHQSDRILVGILSIGVLWLLTDRLALQPLERWTVERWGLVSTEA